MDLFYLIGYELGIAIFFAILALPIFVIVLLVKKIRKSKNTSQPDLHNSEAVQDHQSEPIHSSKSTRDEAKEQRRIQREQQKADAAKARAERLAKKRAKKEAAQIEKRRKKEQEYALIAKAAELNQKFPLIQDIHFTDIEFTCRTRKQYESADPEVIALQYLRENPKEIEFYKRVVIPNAQNKTRYEKAFKSEIAPHTDKRSILKMIKRKGQVGTVITVLIRYRYKDKVSKKWKEDRRLEIVENSDRLFNDVKNGVVRLTEKQQFAKEQRAAMTPSMRYDVLKRDGFRCQICGSTQEDGVKLHVDHIIPVSKGGKTEMKNLRTLCDQCNIGKGAKIEDDRVIGATIGSIDNNLGR